MKILGIEFLGIEFAIGTKAVPQNLNPPLGFNNGWFNIVRESFAGAWQKNIEIKLTNVLTYSAVYSCVTLIASDIGKIELRLMKEDEDGISEETESPSFSPVLRKPNRFQTRIKFIEYWVTSKLIHGNAYILKERDERGIVKRLYVLDPLLTKPLIAPDGSVFYQLKTDQLAGIDEKDVVVPASEIIHDVMVALYHPLCGVSPITACGLAAVQGLSIQSNSANFFANGSRPGGILTAPGAINDETAARLKAHWEQNYAGENVGKVAVLGDGLKYEAMVVNAVDADLINQLKWTAETVCTCFHVPPYMIGVGPPPSYNNIEALNQQYYSQCLQTLIESIELLLKEGLGISEGNTGYSIEFDLDDLLRMDTATQYKTYGDGIKSGLLAPNEGRKKLNLKPVPGGDTPYLQQQNFSLEALDKRDSKEDPFSTKPTTTSKPPAQVEPPQPQKLLEDQRELNGDEIFATLGSALEAAQ